MPNNPSSRVNTVPKGISAGSSTGLDSQVLFNSSVRKSCRQTSQIYFSGATFSYLCLTFKIFAHLICFRKLTAHPSPFLSAQRQHPWADKKGEDRKSTRL